MNRRFLSRLVGSAAIVFAAATVATAATSDAWLTMKTKVSLMTTDGIRTSQLNVDTVNGVVTLHGMVPTEDQKTRAADVARRVDGVKDVKNLLQVVPKSERAVVTRSDEAIKKGVEDAFKANRRVSRSGIDVASVNDGVVLLSGKTKSMEAHLEAIQVADAVRGVRRVSTEVEVEPAS